MSHITKINLLIKDLDALASACDKLGLELVRDQKTFKAYRTGRCEHAIRVKGNERAYEIGIAKSADGKGFELKWDADIGDGGGLYEKVGYETKYGWVVEVGANGVNKGKLVRGSADKLKDWYAAEVARKQMRKQGFMVRTVQRDRKVQVLCSK
jgi:hypothetical protein